LKELEFQEAVGIFDDFTTRAHTVTSLTDSTFWNEVIRKCLPSECIEVVVQVTHFLVAKREDIPLDQKQVDTLRELAT